MDPGYRTPLLDFFRRGDVAGDVRELAARGVLAPRAHEQVALLILLVDDPDPGIAALASNTLVAIPAGALSSFLARSDVPADWREFFRARGIEPAAQAAAGCDQPLVENAAGPDGGEDPPGQAQRLGTLPVPSRLKLAMRGTREQRAILIRDSNRLVAAAVLSSPKLSESEVESFARMANVAEEVLRVIGTTRTWLRNYTILAALARNPKTPPAVSVPLVARLNERDVKMLAGDRNVPEAVRIAARKIIDVGSARKR